MGIYALCRIASICKLVRSCKFNGINYVAIYGARTALFWVALVNLSRRKQYYGDVVNIWGLVIVVHSAD